LEATVSSSFFSPLRGQCGGHTHRIGPLFLRIDMTVTAQQIIDAIDDAIYAKLQGGA